MKKYLFIATALAALASCSSDEFVGDNTSPTTSNTPGAIQFKSDAGKITRATSNEGTVAQMLDGQMKIVGVKKTEGSPSATYATVFNNYILWSNTTNVTTSNPDATTVTAEENGWEYVTASAHNYGTTGTAGTTGIQYIKYWDWSTNEYHFVAGSPVKSFSYTITNGEIASATVSDINGHINPNTGTALSKDPVYIAAPVKKVRGSGGTTEYGTDVQFSFTRQQTFVRVGVYEDIPGYKITSIDFYEWDCDKSGGANWKDDPQNAHNIVLNSKTAKYFTGGAASATVTYDWTTPSSSFVFASADVEQESWYGGKLDLSASNPLATSSTDTRRDYFYGTDSDIDGTTKFFTVLPTPTETTAQPIIIKCDYTLQSLDTDETIIVSGATAAIPAAFCKWNANTSYTYLFKISDNTNGRTGSTQPNEGLYPITFDAVVTSVADGTSQGTVTTVSTPSITTYQPGSVVDVETTGDSPVSKHGIEYTVTNGAIYFTAQNDETGALLQLSALNNTTPAVGMVQVYSVAAGTTEADLILTRPTTTVTTSITDAAWTINGQSIGSGYWAKFTPTDAGTYAIEYVYSVSGTEITARSYKVVVVK